MKNELCWGLDPLCTSALGKSGVLGQEMQFKKKIFIP